MARFTFALASAVPCLALVMAFKAVLADDSSALSLTPVSPHDQGLLEGPGLPVQAAIRSEAEWHAQWSASTDAGNALHSYLVPEVPNIDFQTHTLLMVGLGAKPSGGYYVVIASATRFPDRIVVDAVGRAPGKNCLVAQAFTNPVALSAIPATTLPIVFNVRDEVEDCPEWPSNPSLDRGRDP